MGLLLSPKRLLSFAGVNFAILRNDGVIGCGQLTCWPDKYIYILLVSCVFSCFLFGERKYIYMYAKINALNVRRSSWRLGKRSPPPHQFDMYTVRESTLDDPPMVRMVD